MRFQFYCLLVLLLLTGHCFAQHVEYNFGAVTGLFHYASDKSDEMEMNHFLITAVNPYVIGVNPYANDPRGEKSGFSFQFTVTAKKVTRHNFLWGIDAEFQSLQSKEKLHYVFFSDSMYNATGQCDLRNKYIDLFPYFGKRIIIKKMYLDITGGFELAMNFFNANEIDRAVIISTGQFFTASINSRGGGYSPWDGRFRLQSMLGFDTHWGMSLGYAWGLTNLDGQTASDHSHSRYAQIGIVYTLYGKHKTKLH